MKNKAIIFALIIVLFTCFSYAAEEDAPTISKSILFSGKLEKTAPSIALEAGTITELRNMQRPSPAVPIGWERRGGTTRYSTSRMAQSVVGGIFQITNDEFNINKVFTQNNQSIYMAENSDVVVSLGTNIYSLDSGVSNAFGEKINDDMIFAAAGNTPWAYSGASAYPDAFLVSHETGNTLYADGWDRVRDKRQDTNIILVEHSGASEMMYYGFRRRLSGFTIDTLSGGTDIGSGITLEARRSGDWAAVAGFATLSTTTKVIASWTASGLDEPYLLPGTKNQLYWYRSGVTNDVPNGIKAWRVRVNDRCEEMTNLWSGYYQIAVGAMKSTVTGYQDYLGEITDGTDVNYMDVGALTTSYAAYFGFINPASGIKLNIVNGYENSSTAMTATVYYWDSVNGWVTVGTIEDGTSMNGYALGQSGLIMWDGSQIHEDKRALGGSLTPLYWYQVKWSVTVPSDTRIYEVAQAQKPETIPPFPKYSCVRESNGYAVFGPSVYYKNGIDFAQMGWPHIINGPLRGMSGPIFGPGTVNTFDRINDMLFVSTMNPYRLYLNEGKVPGKWDALMVSDQVGSIGPHTMVVVNDAIKRFSTTKTTIAAILLDAGGIYIAERIPIKISGPIQNYWDTSTTPYIEPSYADRAYAWIDYQNSLVCFAVPMNFTGSSSTQTTNNVVIPYNYITDEFYDLWVFADPPSAGSAIMGSDNQRKVMLGTYNGYVDVANTGNSDYVTAIEHYVTTADILPLAGALPDFLNYSSILRGIKTKSKAKSSGDIEVVAYADGDTSGVTLTSIPLTNSGKRWTMGKTTANEKGESFSIRFRSGIDNADEWLDDFVGFTMDFQPLRETQVQ